MPPRRASAGAKKRVVRAVRSTRSSAAAAAAAAAAEQEEAVPKAPEETLASESPAAAEASVVEVPTGGDEVARRSPTPVKVTHEIAVNPILGPTSAIEPSAAEDKDAVMEVKDVGTVVPEVVPQVTEVLVSADEGKVTTGCPEADITPQDSVSEARPTNSIPESGASLGEETHAIGAAKPVTGVARAVPVVKKITKIVRKVTRRVPVKRVLNKKETEFSMGNEDKGNEGGKEAVPLTASEEHSSHGAEPISVQIEGASFTDAGAPSVSAEGQNPNEVETINMSVDGKNSSDAEAASISVEDNKPVAVFEQPSAPHEPSSDVCPAVVVPEKKVRKVKKIIVVKKHVKVKGAPKREENAEGDEQKKLLQNEERMEEAHVGKVEKVEDTDANIDEQSKDGKQLDLEAEAAGSLKTNVDAAPVLNEDDFERDESNRNANTEREKVEGEGASSADQMIGMSERQKRRKTEIFIGGLDREAKEDDIRKVFGKVGEVVEVRMMMDKKTGKNKGYAFLRYSTPAQAKQAVAEFSKVEVCGKQCGAAALEGNDTIFLGNIDKKWTKVDVTSLLHEIGIEKIDTVTLMPDPKNPECNRGFAFLDFETNKDAQAAFKKLQKKDALGKGRNIKVAWAEPLVDPDEEEMQKVKSVFAEGIPSSWDEKKVREHFQRFGQIERVVLSRNMPSAKRKDFAFVNFTTREAALSCIELFEKDIMDDGSKVNVKVSLAKPVQKNKQNKAGMASNMKDNTRTKLKAIKHESKVILPAAKSHSRGSLGKSNETKSSANRQLLHVPREQGAWKEYSYSRGPIVPGPIIPDYSTDLHGRKRPLSAVGETALYADSRGYPRTRLDSAYPVANSSSFSHGPAAAATSLEYHQQPSVRYGSGSFYGATDAQRAYGAIEAPRTYDTVEARRPYGAVEALRAYSAVDASRPYQARPGSAPFGGFYSRCEYPVGFYHFKPLGIESPVLFE